MNPDGGILSEACQTAVRPEYGRSGVEGFDLVALENRLLFIFFHRNELVPYNERLSLGREHIWVYFFGYDGGFLREIRKEEESDNGQ